MDGSNLASDVVIAELVSMGFEISEARKAIKEVGPSLNNAIDFILSGCTKVSSRKGALPDTGAQSVRGMRQSSIMDHLQSSKKPASPVSIPYSNEDWEVRANMLLQKHFGYPLLKRFQREALGAWIAQKDCLVLAATGSGKSLCFQIPALLTGKVVVVISPLISLMHDQCLKLAKHGVSACFLGSGQIDQSVQQKAMRGMYEIIYVCPETILRLIKPFESLAEQRGIALFAIDEVHCVSKWGHDFRPDYRRLSALRENFNAKKLPFLEFDIPIMALTATATIRVREDIITSLHMSEDPMIVLTSFFRPNLRFSVKHSRTCSSSYEKDFRDLIDAYSKNTSQKYSKKTNLPLENMSVGTSSRDDICNWEERASESEEDDEDITLPKRRKLSVEYLEDESDLLIDVDDFDVTCGEFDGRTSTKDLDVCEGKTEGLTIIYVPTRKETLSIAKYLCRCGVKAAAYHAKLPKSQLRQVHKEFHENALQVVVATIAFGMGIDKLNVRRIIHYGWPQSLEAYYQEAGRAGRDGKLADCVLFANLSRMPSLLPNRRSEEQTRQAYKMLSDCFRYAMRTSRCRAQMLVQYFGEDFSDDSCHLCDVCVKGPPEQQNLKDEARILMQMIAAHYDKRSYMESSYDDDDYNHNIRMEKPNVKMFVCRIQEQNQQLETTDLLWWRGLVRILEDKGFLREGDDKAHVQIKYPEPTKLGLEFAFAETEMVQSFNVWPEADMLLSKSRPKSYSSFVEWGKGWADPEIRKRRLSRNRPWKQPRRTNKQTVRGRLAAKLSK
ncbi:putative DNA helicase [Helianthus annuus]|uniref:ATP-dependent DNA helicase n=2 Tax=Helianthus annuus TaxID=4232 RepID=A0A9K3NW04_HELAN|nr:ATP-dependent DNA helicase Q-like SIM [Helianthus annuus]XP_022028250.1 ATP-dependent DNA helicase Q-like SIM [Helianthus annuus]KAF5813593.1 putative DNA helicase [Helianthus annuus]KAJ0592316.1 putative DNA helicase [Helianthus annuus]KAJ0599832.1 putative DNA helicase [Helianthus annuus]KAJ0607301.1 putative DNA helicase [Helianthus annuus]KAJ0767361.1 putative DNA helicase [Helianthus annuus]